MSKIKILLFGASEAGLNALTHLSNKVVVIGFIDNDSKKIGTKYQGFPIFSPTELSNLEYDFIIITSMYLTEIHSQLIDLGIDESKIVSGIDEDGNFEPFPWDAVLFLIGSFTLSIVIIITIFAYC